MPYGISAVSPGWQGNLPGETTPSPRALWLENVRDSSPSASLCREHLPAARVFPRGLRALADRVQVQQVILNLVVNALEALASTVMQHKRELLVTSEFVGEQDVCVSVHDNGPGLPTPRSEDCFEAFFSTKTDGLTSYHRVGSPPTVAAATSMSAEPACLSQHLWR